MTHRAAMKSPFADQWRKAEQEEMDSLTGRSVWKLVPRPANTNIVSCKWVYKTKEDSDGNPVRYKARLVARGFTQVEGIDYEETFAPTAKFVTIRLIISLATGFGWPLEQADIDTAFLWSELHEDIFMQQPEGHVDPQYPEYVCKLLKSLYGLKQAAHLWNRLLSKTLKALGFVQLLTDTSCFVKFDKDGIAVIMAVYVDDLVITGRTTELVKQTIRDLKGHFQVKELGPAKWILGISVDRNLEAGTTIIHQKKYINDMVSRFGQQDAAPIGLPYAGGDEKQPEEVTSCDPKETSRYRSIVGSLLYAAVATRPDITETVTRLCRAMQSPNTTDMKKAIRCIRYLKGTADLGIQYSGNSGLLCYCDSNWGGPLERRLSRTGYAFLLNNGAIIFRSLMQKAQALSTAEAEYVALCAAAQDGAYLLQMLNEMGMGDNAPITTLEDNQACISIGLRDIAPPKLKHIDIKYHYVRTMVQEGQIKVVYCPTYHQAADILTKGTDKLTFLRHRSTLMGLPSRP
jgi:hypothetical protein